MSGLIIIVLVSAIIGCRPQQQAAKSNEQDLLYIQSTKHQASKKVIFLLVDALMAQAIDQGIQRQELPTFQYLIQHGQYYKDMVSSFPTMSVTIDSSLLTGSYPNEHHVPGLTWYSTEARKVINYGTGPMEIFKHGIESVMLDGLIHLNATHLNPQLPTIYEDLARHGLKSASINGLIYRGRTPHTLTIPSWVQGITSIPKEIKVHGPDFMALGALSNPLQGKTSLPKSVFRKMGLNSAYSIETLNYLIQANTLPDFSLVYLPDIDQQIHRKGPANMKDVKGIRDVDQQLHTMLQAFGSPEKALSEAVIIIAGDSGMTQILPSNENPVIDLPALLQNDHVLRPGKAVTADTEIVLAVNETMAYVYNIGQQQSLRGLATKLSLDPRMDYIAWKEDGWIYVKQGNSDRELRYKVKGDFSDPYQQRWSVEGDIDVLDLQVDYANYTLHYGQYPDALQRLQGALLSHPGDYIVVGAKPGYELVDRSSPTHKGGGGHGSLRHEESLVPLILCGTDQKPKHLRIIDLKPFILQLLIKNEGE
ncbi:alkaline phosphatase family protein [Paenibacillus terrigena]|uniref:alkaline phosphatase family protein n=1 Tax=Paenibacillus terrigena TaxID=369333 RepID=UPI000362A6C0|nr:alkaline phosphatase family protein [Paenibacillus terrigena]